MHSPAEKRRRRQSWHGASRHRPGAQHAQPVPGVLPKNNTSEIQCNGVMFSPAKPVPVPTLLPVRCGCGEYRTRPTSGTASTQATTGDPPCTLRTAQSKQSGSGMRWPEGPCSLGGGTGTWVGARLRRPADTLKVPDFHGNHRWVTVLHWNDLDANGRQTRSAHTRTPGPKQRLHRTGPRTAACGVAWGRHARRPARVSGKRGAELIGQ